MKKCKVQTCESTDLATRSAMCKEHHREYTRAHYRANKESYLAKAKKRNTEQFKKHRTLITDYLKNNPCVDCGNSDVEVLQFDHRDRELKVAEVSALLTGSTKRLLDEIDKCDVRCANCHTKRTRRQMGWWHNAEVEVETPMVAMATMPGAIVITDGPN